MPTRRIQIYLTGLLYCCSACSFSVICHSADGRIVIEPVFHDRCECPEKDDMRSQGGAGEAAAIHSGEHDHCTDFPTVANVIVPDNKTVKSTTHASFTGPSLQQAHASSAAGGLALGGNEPPSFHTPLRTVIILS